MMVPLAQKFEFLRRTGRAASFGSQEGLYPFFTSSPEVTKKTDIRDCEGPALVFGTGGTASLHYVDGPFSATNDCYVAVPRSGDKEDARYFYHYLQTHIHLIEDGFRGAGLKHVSKKHLETLKLPIVQGAYRERVIALLDKADAVRRKQEQALSMVDNYLKSSFQHNFGEPYSNEHGFEVVCVEDLCEVISDCLHTTPRHFDEPNDYPSIRSSDLQGGYIDLSNAKYVTEAEYNVRIQRYRPSPGDVIYCREGARFGSVGRVPKGMTPCLGQRTMLFKADKEKTTPEYLWSVLRSEFIFEQAKKVVGGAASPHVNIRDIRKFVCLLPPIALQRTYGSVCNNGLQQREKMLAQYQEAKALFGSLSQRAFHGEL